VIRTAEHRLARAPLLATRGPSLGVVKAARIPPSATAPDISVDDQPNSMVIGATKIVSVATAGPCRAKAAQEAQASTTQP